MLFLRNMFFYLVRKYKTILQPQVKLDASGGVNVYPSVDFDLRYNKTGWIKIGKGSRIGTSNRGYRITFFHPTRISARGEGATIEIGENAFINGANIFARKSVKIGNHAHIGGGVTITDLNAHLTYSLNRDEGEDHPEPVIIGNNVWIGLDAIILKGTEIGDNSVVAAGSVVKGKFPEFSLIGGNPAKLIKILDKSKFE